MIASVMRELVWAVLRGAAGWGQESFTVAGRVVNAVTGEGVGRALVQLDGYPGQRGGSPYMREVFSDGTGAFRFEGVPKASITVSARKPQFTVTPSKMMELTASREDVTVRLDPMAVIQGTVTDDAGRPMQGVQVRAYEHSISNGRKTLYQLRSVPTDDRGQYRMWNMRPGDVYVRAVGRAGGIHPPAAAALEQPADTAVNAALKKAKVPGELHVFAKGRHGLGLALDVPGTSEWSKLCQTWMQNRGLLATAK